MYSKRQDFRLLLTTIVCMSFGFGSLRADACTGQPDGTPCDDGDLCTIADICTSEVCGGTPVPDCTITAENTVCANSSGHVAFVPPAGKGATYVWTLSGGTIDSGQATQSITYSVGGGFSLLIGVTVTDMDACENSCQKKVPIIDCGPPCEVDGDCDDGVVCTLNLCLDSFCKYVPDDSLCDDSLYCTGVETCDAVLDCQSGTPVDCDDANPCTYDACKNETCTNTPFCTGDLYEPATLSVPPAAPGYCGGCTAEINPLRTTHLHSGEFKEQVVDLAIKGRGLHFVWARTYGSRTGPDTAMGNGWDFSYNIYVEAAGPNLIVHDGNTRADMYVLQPNGTWTRPGFFRVLTQNPDQTYTLRFCDKAEWNFNAIDGSPAQGRIASSIDRNGNAISFDYDKLVHRHSKTCGFLVQFSDPSMVWASSHQIMEDRHGYWVQEVHHPPERG